MMKRTLCALAFVFLEACLFGQVTPYITSQQQFLDNNAHPLVAGCVFTYAAGTSTPQATFTDSSGGVQNANPIILNAGGFPSSGVWLSATSYKFIVKSFGGTSCASGSTIRTEDNIPGAYETIGGSQTITGNKIFTGNVTISNLNGTCIVSTTQTLQACLTLAIANGGNYDILIPVGTWSYTTAPAVIANANINNLHIIGAGKNATKVKYTGSTPIQAVIDIGPATPNTQLLFDYTVRDLTLQGNANVTNCLRTRSLQTSTIQDIECKDVAGAAFQFLNFTGMVFNHLSATGSDGVPFLVTPTNCIDAGELPGGIGSATSSSFITPRCENVSGYALYLHNAVFNTFGGGQIANNGGSLDIENGSGGASFPSSLNTFDSMLFEAETGATGILVNSPNNKFTADAIGFNPGAKMVIGADNITIENSQVGTKGITINAGVKNTHLVHVLMDPSTLTDNGTNTQLQNNYNLVTNKQWLGLALPASTYRQVIPNFAVSDGLTGGTAFDAQDHPFQGCWNLTTTPIILSTTPMTTAKPWRALLMGSWQNNTGLVAQTPEVQEITSVANTLAVGTVTVTFSVNGSGQFQAVTGASAAAFCGTIFMFPHAAVGATAGTAYENVKGVHQWNGDTGIGRYTPSGAGAVAVGNGNQDDRSGKLYANQVLSNGQFIIDNAAGAFTVFGGATFDVGISRDAAGIWDFGSSLTQGDKTAKLRAALYSADGGTVCTNGELALSAGWGTTASVASVAGTGQTCQWTITSAGTGQAANPTITDTLTNTLPSASTVCDMRMTNGTGTFTNIDFTTASATAPVFTFLGTPVAASTYKVVRRCGP